MRIKVHGADLSSAMRVIKKCINPKFQNFANVEITHKDNVLSLRGTNGTFSASASIPLLGGDGESFCVDGDMFARICAMNNREVELSTEGKSCVIRGSGRTRLPVLEHHVPETSDVKGKQVRINAGEFARCCEQVKHAIATDETRLILTGALVETDGSRMSMTTIDGFKLAIESAECTGDSVRIVIPGAFITLVSSAVDGGEQLTLATDGHVLAAETDFMKMKCGLLSGDYPDVSILMPASFSTECLVRKDDVLKAIKSGNAIMSGREPLVKFAVGTDVIRVTNNSETADYEADVECSTTGNPLTIAFNSEYLEKSLSSMVQEEVVLHMNTASGAMVITGREGDGKRLILPVRTR